MSPLYRLAPARVARAVDAARDERNQPLSREARARVYAAVEVATDAAWRSARPVIVGCGLTLWQAVTRMGHSGQTAPAPEVVVAALEHATGLARRERIPA